MILIIVIAGLAIFGVGRLLVLREKKTPAPEKMVRQVEDATKLGTLCSGENGCNEYCKNNLGRCKEYCRTHPENTLCQNPFSFEIPAAGEKVTPIENKAADKIIPAPTPPVTIMPPTPIIPVAPIIPQIKKFEIAKPQPWVFDSITQPVPSGASKTRLTSFPAPLDKSYVEGSYGAHRGGHPEGLDHEWIGIPDDTPVLNWARGEVTHVFLNNPDVPDDWRIFIDYGDGLSGEHMDVKTPLVKKGDTVKAGQGIAYGKTQAWNSGYHSGEFNLVDQHRIDGVMYRDGATVSPFDYLEEDLKQEVIAMYTKKSIEPYTQRGEFFMGFTPWEPYLTNPLVFHKQYKGTLAGEWYLKNKKWTNDSVPDVMTLLSANTKYYSKQRVIFGEDRDDGGFGFEGEWEADYNVGRVLFTNTGRGTHFGIFELDESGPRALLKIEYATSSYPLEFSDKAYMYIERDAIQRREDGYRLKVIDSLY